MDNKTSVRESLDPEQVRAIRALHELKPIYTLKLPALYALAALLGWVMIAYPYWFVRIPGYFAMSCIFAGLGVLLHDGAHGLLFKSKILNRTVSQVLAGSL